MRSILFIITIGLCMACASETEQKSLDKVAEIYDATTSYSKGFNSSMGQETVRKFTAKVSGSKLIDSLNPNVTSGNIALIVFDGFTEDEKTKYQTVDVELVNSKGDTLDYSYAVDILSKLHKKSEVFHTFSSSLIERKASQIDAIRNQEHIPPPIGDQLVARMSEYSDDFGTLIAYEPFGIAEVSDAEGAAYQFQSYLVFSSGKKIPYLVVVDIVPGKDKLDGFKFFD